jgi:hypothetical protein
VKTVREKWEELRDGPDELHRAWLSAGLDWVLNDGGWEWLSSLPEDEAYTVLDSFMSMATSPPTQENAK